MTTFARSDTSIVGRWLWTVDRPTLAAVGLLIVAGILMAFASSPSAADRYGLDHFYFAWRQSLHFFVAVAVMFAVSLLSPRGALTVSVLVLVVAVPLVVATFVVGSEIKGANRWLRLGMIVVQPSEFLKPAFAVIAAALFAGCRSGALPSGNLISTALFCLLIFLLSRQPDIGMAVVVALVWMGQFFIAGLRLLTTAVLVLCGIGVMIGAYLAFPHVSKRVDNFLDPQIGNSYQIDLGLAAIRKGGLFGLGPGEGTVKNALPDSHSDFVFAVAGEEFGTVFCLALIALFGFIVLRSLVRIMRETDLFVLLAGSGLAFLFGAQALINIGSTLHLIPTKGMTLPFVSYGGSSLTATALGIGLLLAMTRRRPEQVMAS